MSGVPSKGLNQGTQAFFLVHLLTWLIGLLPQVIVGQLSQCNFFQPFMCVCVCVCVCVWFGLGGLGLQKLQFLDRD